MKLTNYIKTTLCLATTAALIGCMSPGSSTNRSTGRTIDDNATTSRVKSALNKDSLVKASKINVSTYLGNVHLTGLVDHPIQRERATQITRNVDGVEWFKNDIVVISELPGQQMAEPAGAQRPQQQAPSGAKWQPGSGSNAAKSTSGTGAYEPSGASNDLSQRVNNTLATQNVHGQTAADGKVTLQGTVSSEAEKNAIEKQIKSIQGVNSVDNQLQVKDQ